MTAYADFIQDFPLRCGDILQSFYGQAKDQNREVTLLIMTAAASLVIPFERLRMDKSEGVVHASGDTTTFEAQAQALKVALKSPFLKSAFWEKGANGSWRAGATENIATPPDSWEGFSKRRPLCSDDQANMIVARLRNALAHGNIFVRPREEGAVIAEIVFASENREKNGYNFISVKPDDFHAFMMKWLAFMEKYKEHKKLIEDHIGLAA